MDFFVNLLIKEISAFWIKLLATPFLALGMLYIIQIIVLKVSKPKHQWYVHQRLCLLVSIVITIILYNLFWLFIIHNNGVVIFDWSSFTFTRNNIYFMLSPVILGYLLLLYLYFRTEGQIKKAL